MRLGSVILILVFSFLFPLKLKAQSDLEARIARLEALSLLDTQQFKPVLGGMIQYDAAIYGSDTRLEKSKRSLNLENGSTFRRVRLSARGRLSDQFKYRTQWQTDGTEFSILSTYIQVETGLGRFRIGNEKVPQSQDQMRSSRDLSFLERATISDVMDFGRALGVTGFHKIHPKLHLMTGVYSGTIDPRDADVKSVTVAGARAVLEVLKGDDHGLYFSTYYTRVSNADRPRFRTDLQSRLSRERILDTNRITDVSKFYHTGIELSGMLNRARFVGQLSTLGLKDRQSFLVPNNTAAKSFDGYSLELGFMLTEDRRDFDQSIGHFDGIKPNLSLSESGIGALELASRLSSIDLNDGEGSGKINGGSGQVISLALNWVPVKGILFISEVAQANIKILKNNLEGRERLRYLQMRFQADF